MTKASRMIVTSRLFGAYLRCPTKCWLRSRAEPAAGNIYAEWDHAQNEAYRADSLERLLATNPECDYAIAPLLAQNTRETKWRLAIDVVLRTSDLESRLAAVEGCPQKGDP